MPSYQSLALFATCVLELQDKVFWFRGREIFFFLSLKQNPETSKHSRKQQLSYTVSASLAEFLKYLSVCNSLKLVLLLFFFSKYYRNGANRRRCIQAGNLWNSVGFGGYFFLPEVLRSVWLFAALKSFFFFEAIYGWPEFSRWKLGSGEEEKWRFEDEASWERIVQRKLGLFSSSFSLGSRRKVYGLRCWALYVFYLLAVSVYLWDFFGFFSAWSSFLEASKLLKPWGFCWRNCWRLFVVGISGLMLCSGRSAAKTLSKFHRKRNIK